MKKNILIKLLFVLFIMFSFNKNVLAANNKGTLYELGYQSSGVNVYAEDTTYNSMDYNGWIIKSTVDEGIYYCIEPETYMPNKSEAVTGSHKVYKDDDIIKNSRLDAKGKEYISLLAYYGYKYPGHEDKKWYGITQVLIWQYLRSDIKWEFKESRFGSVNKNLYQNEVKELKNLVSNHKTLPSFSKDEIVLNYNESKELIDKNNSLNKFILEDNALGAKISGNKLIIPEAKPGKYTLKFKMKRINNDIELFKSTSVQDLISRGDVNYVDFNMEVVVNGEVIIHKKDKDTNSFVDTYKYSLIGTEFEIIDKDTSSKVLTIDVTGPNEKIVLPSGNYIIKEVKSGKGYILNTDTIEFVIDGNHSYYEFDFYNEKEMRKFYFQKFDADTKEPLEGALFSIYDEETLEKVYEFYSTLEKIELELPIGKYYIVEDFAPQGYIKYQDKIYFSLYDEDNIEIYMTNKKIENPDTFDNINSYLIILIISSLICFTIFSLKKVKLNR